METRTITLTMPDSLVRHARVLAAQRDTSVSALVADLLQQLVEDAADYDSIWAGEEAAMAARMGMQVGNVTWARDDLHER